MDIERNGERLLLNETCLRVLLLNMADEDYLEDNHSDEEEYDEDYARSEHGETTEAENEIVFYWERLRRGVMSHPVRLQVQCLLYIIGHISFDANVIGVGSQTGLPLTGISIFINNARRYLPPNSLGLLPRSIRIKLLLLLPAVDVAKLEGTPVTSGISMNEIWETICKERLPLHKKKDIECEIGSTIGTLEDLREEGVESVSWKEAYFNIAFLFSQLFFNHVMSLEDDECGCVYNHFLPDLFYSMDTFYSDPFSSELYQCFNEESSLSIHEVYRCAHKCPRLTPGRYYNKYPDPSSPQRRECEYNMSLWDVIYKLADCNVSLKHLHMSNVHFKEITSSLNNVDFIDRFSKLLTSVEAITVHLCYLKEDKFQQFMKKIFDIIFVQKKCPIRYVNVPDEYFKAIYPFLMESPQCNLKQFGLVIEETSQESFAGDDLPQLAINYSRKVQEPSPVTIDESLSRSIINVLQHHQGLQKLSLYIDVKKANELKLDAELIECMSDLLLRPVFKELVFGNFRYQKPVSPDIVLCLFRKFFSSPCPVSMTLNRLDCPEFPVNTDPFTINHDQAAGKSLQMDDCTFSPNFLSLLPRSLVLKSLTIDDYHLKILPSFAELELITVNSFSLRCGCHQGNLAIISSLFRVVNAQQWSLSLSLSDEIIEEFISLLSKVSHLLCQFEITNWSIPFDNLISMIETIFFSLLPANLSQFELSLHNHLFSDDVANALYKSWEKCGAVKLKKITVFNRREYAKPTFMSILLDMANEVYVERNR